MPTTYVAFPRGINSGKNPRTKMDVLKKAFSNMGFTDISTVLASGNVIFESDETDVNKLEEIIFKNLPPIIGFESAVLVRSASDLLELSNQNIFSGYESDKNTNRYVSFIDSDQQDTTEYPIKTDGIVIINNYNGIICSLVNLDKASSPDLMKELEKRFGKNITTRNWNTILKIVKTNQ